MFIKDRRLAGSLMFSIGFNLFCVAVVGSAALRHYTTSQSQRKVDELHPMPLKLGTIPQDTSSDKVQSVGDSSADNGSNSSSNNDSNGQSNSSSTESLAQSLMSLLRQQLNGNNSLSNGQKSLLETAEKQQLTPIQQKLVSMAEHIPMSATQRDQLARAMMHQLTPTQKQILADALQKSSSPSQKEQLSQLASKTDLTPTEREMLDQILAKNDPKAKEARLAQQSQQAKNPDKQTQDGKGGNQSNEAGKQSDEMNEITKAGTPHSHLGDSQVTWGNSIATKYLKYPKADVNLGTIHELRPDHGIAGGGRADASNVNVTAHYVVDDPNNIPKNLPPNKLIRLFLGNCSGPPNDGIIRKIPVGGNINFGGGTKHGHNHISGVLYGCIPGAGGIAPGGHSANGTGKNEGKSTNNGLSSSGAGEGQAAPPALSAEYNGRGPENNVIGSMNEISHQPDNFAQGSTANALHLPSKHGDFTGMIPGAKVPVEDRAYVDDPEAHDDAAEPGRVVVQSRPFVHSPKDIGSLSINGTVSWKKPVRVQTPKLPYGGDGTGLLGMYYYGGNFDKLAHSRPDRNIDFDWTDTPPAPFQPNNPYSVRWLGELVPKVSDDYTLMIESDDGERVYLDGKLIVADWSDHAPSEDVAHVHLAAGHAYDLKVEYYENGNGLASVKLYWESPKVQREYIPEDCLRYPSGN